MCRRAERGDPWATSENVLGAGGRAQAWPSTWTTRCVRSVKGISVCGNEIYSQKSSHASALDYTPFGAGLWYVQMSVICETWGRSPSPQMPHVLHLSKEGLRHLRYLPQRCAVRGKRRVQKPWEKHQTHREVPGAGVYGCQCLNGNSLKLSIY